MTDLADRRDMETEVYQPAEDSVLLLEAVRDRIDPDDRVLEVGTGSGYVAGTLQSETGAAIVGSDVNPNACRAASDRGVEVVQADLVEPFREASFDVVLFNPPYLPETEMTTREDWMAVALTGGEDGRAIIEPFIRQVERVLAPGGSVYLLVSSLSGIEAVEQRASDAGFETSECGSDSFPFETIVVLELIPTEG